MSMTLIPLDALPPPPAVVAEDYAALRDAALVRLAALLPDDFELDPADPSVRLIELAVFLRMLLGARINDAVKATWLATAEKADLDQVAAGMNVSRRAGEDDEDLRRRAQLAWVAASTAGPLDAYRFHALGVPGVADAAIASSDEDPALTPGRIRVTVLASAAGGVADDALLTAVRAAVSADDVRPATDDVTVQAAAIVAVPVTATLTVGTGPDPAVVTAASAAAVRRYLTGLRIGADVPLSGLYAALHGPGVEAVALTAPAADVAVPAVSAAVPGAIEVTAA